MCFSNMFGYQTQYFLFGQFLILSEHSPEISPMTLLSFSYQGHLVRSVLGTDHTTRVSCRGTTFSDKHTTRIILMQSCIPLLYHYYPKICPILSGKAIHIYIYMYNRCNIIAYPYITQRSRCSASTLVGHMAVCSSVATWTLGPCWTRFEVRNLMGERFSEHIYEDGQQIDSGFHMGYLWVLYG